MFRSSAYPLQMMLAFQERIISHRTQLHQRVLEHLDSVVVTWGTERAVIPGLLHQRKNVSGWLLELEQVLMLELTLASTIRRAETAAGVPEARERIAYFEHLTGTWEALAALPSRLAAESQLHEIGQQISELKNASQESQRAALRGLQVWIPALGSEDVAARLALKEKVRTTLDEERIALQGLLARTIVNVWVEQEEVALLADRFGLRMTREMPTAPTQEGDGAPVAAEEVIAGSQGAAADTAATAQEKDARLERLQPEDLLWKDFTDFLREAPVLTRGKKGAANMLNNPPDSPFLFLYEAAWRDAAVRRLPPEVVAALDLTRRDPGTLAKYTRILVERLRREGLLVTEHEGMTVPDVNPLWDIQSGPGEKAIVIRDVLVLDAELLWKKLNYRLAAKSPFPVKVLAPSALPLNPKASKDALKVSDGMPVSLEEEGVLADLGLEDTPGSQAWRQRRLEWTSVRHKMETPGSAARGVSESH